MPQESCLQTKMSTRDKFLKEFISVTSNFSENISIYYGSENSNVLGISYFELNKVSDELSLYFLKHFGRKSQYVAVSVRDYFFLSSIILAVWKSGYCFAGVGCQYTKKNNLEFLNFLGVKYIIGDSADNNYDGELLSEFRINERRYFIWGRDPRIKEAVQGGLDSICYGIMTSGSTGEPKIIQVPWSCILPNAVELSKEFQVTPSDCIFQASPYSFDPFFIELFMTLLTGCSLMIVSNLLKLCPSDLLTILFGVCEKHLKSSPLSCAENENYFHVNTQPTIKKNITVLQMTPSVFKRWTNTEIKECILCKDTTLRILILGGEIFPKDILKLKCHDNKTRIFNIYGITEVSCWSFINEISNYSDRISIGRPLNNIIYKITENSELEIGSCSRVCFVNKEKISEVHDPVFRKTGDIVEVVEHKIYFIGRNNQTVKKYGMKINLTYIELSFLNVNPSIKECFAIYNEENLKLGLFYVPVSVDKITVDCNPKTVEFFQNDYTIPDVKDIEKPDYFIEITKLPLNSHGKCDRRKLLQFLKGVKMERSEENLKNEFKSLWVEILGTTHPNLFFSSFTELGGNSVLGLKLITKLEDEGFNVPQNFITILLGKIGFSECLKCLCLAQDESGAPSKRFKFHTETESVKLSIRWKFDLGKCVDATPTVFNYQGEERIVIGSHSSQLSCIDPASGCHIWTTFLGDRIESGFKPTKDGSKGFIGSYDRCVYCIACSDGDVIWKFKTGDMVKSTPCLSTDEKTVYVGSYDTNLYCLSVDKGQLKTSLKLSNGGIFSAGIVSDYLNNLYIGTLDGTCIAVNQHTNEPTWKITLESPVFASPCLTSNQNEVLFSEVLGNVHCFNALTGAKVWTYKAAGNIYSSPIAEEFNGVNHIIFGCHDACLYCLRRGKEPELKWKQHLDSSVFAKPSVVLGSSTVCVATTKGFIYLCDFDSGSVQTRLKLDGEVFSSPVCNNDRLFVGCRDNYVYGICILKV